MCNTTVMRPAGSRRFFLAGAAGLALDARRCLAQQAPPTDPDAASLMTRNNVNRLTIEVRINDTGPYRFIVDTGAERSVIADTVAATLNLPYGQPIAVDSIAGRIMTPTIAVNTLVYGPFVRTDLRLPVLPRSQLLVDGYLGLDAISGSRVTLDFRNHALLIEQPRTALHPPGSDSASIKVRGEAGRLRVSDCTVDNVPAMAFIDTGAEVSVGNPSLKAALFARNTKLTTLAQMILTGVTGGEVTGDIIPVSRINLQGLAFTNGTVVIADIPDFDNWHAHNRPALLIGMDYLRQFAKVTIDYRFKELRFDLSLAPPKPTPGVEIVART